MADPIITSDDYTCGVGVSYPVLFSTTNTGDSLVWSFGQNSVPSSASGLGPHLVWWSTVGSKTISFTVIDDYCIKQTTKSVDVNQDLTALVDFGDPNDNCPGDSITWTSTSTGGSGSYSYAWYDPSNSLIGTGQSISHLLVSGTYQFQLTDSNGCGDNLDKTISACFTDPDDNVSFYSSTNYKIYPNPTNNVLIVEYLNYEGNNLSINIYDPSGKNVFKRSEALEQGLNSIQLDLSHLHSGIYFISLENEQELIVDKFSIIHK